MIVSQIHLAIATMIPRAEADLLDPASFVYPNEFYEMKGTPYAIHRYMLASPFGAPCNPPPWAASRPWI